jgi:mRNA interferase RelE/StbE
MFEIFYHPDVVRKDIPQLSPDWRAAVRAAIEEKLTERPEIFGKPLRQSLRGYRKLRVGDYRVVFRIGGQRVFILAILHRSIVYARAQKRMKG